MASGNYVRSLAERYNPYKFISSGPGHESIPPEQGPIAPNNRSRIELLAAPTVGFIESTQDSNMPVEGPLSVNVYEGYLDGALGSDTSPGGPQCFITKIKIQIFSDEGAEPRFMVYESQPTGTFVETLVNSPNGQGEVSKFIYNAIPGQAPPNEVQWSGNLTTPSQYIGKRGIYTFYIPDGILKGNTNYYWRVLPEEKEVYVSYHDHLHWFHYDRTYEVTKWGKTFSFKNWTATQYFKTVDLAYYADAVMVIAPIDKSYSTIQEAPELEITKLPEEGGTVKIYWDGGHNAKEVTFDSNPIVPELPFGPTELSNLTTDGLQLTIIRPTTIIMKVKNDYKSGDKTTGGGFTISKTISLEGTPTYNLPWGSTDTISLNSEALSGKVIPNVVTSGSKYTINLYTEYMKTAGAYLYYPLQTPIGTPNQSDYENTEIILSMNQVVPHLLKSDADDFPDADDVPVNIVIVPPPSRNLPPYSIISGAYGVAGMGKDNIYRKKLIGYFNLLTLLPPPTPDIPPPEKILAITRLNPNSGPIGTIVNIIGTKFGATQGTGSVQFYTGMSDVGIGQGAPIPSLINSIITLWSDTVIVTSVPDGSEIDSPGIIFVTTGDGSTVPVITTDSNGNWEMPEYAKFTVTN